MTAVCLRLRACVLMLHSAPAFNFLPVRSIRARRALQQYHQAGVSLHNVTASSDAFGSLPSYDSDGRLVKYNVADAKALLRFLRNMYFQVRWCHAVLAGSGPMGEQQGGLGTGMMTGQVPDP